MSWQRWRPFSIRRSACPEANSGPRSCGAPNSSIATGGRRVGKPPPDGEFSVAEFFADGTYRYVERWLPAKEAVELAKFWTDRPAASLGWMTKVIITDGGDFTVFEWQHGKGVIY